jgi:hypothetical protein
MFLAMLSLLMLQLSQFLQADCGLLLATLRKWL